MHIQLQVIGQVVAALAVALLIAFISTPVVKNLAYKMGAVDVPKDSRRMHKHPIPRMGGLAIFLGFILSVLIFLPLSEPLRGMLLGAVIIVVLGIFDDIYTLTMDVNLTGLTLQESEVQAVKWANEDEILAMLADGRFIPYHQAFIRLLFALKDSRGAHVSRLG